MHSDANFTNSNNFLEASNIRSGKHLENIDVKMNVRGIGAVGDSAVELKYRSGMKSTELNISISNNLPVIFTLLLREPFKRVFSQ